LLEAAEGETRTTEGCCRRGAAWSSVADSFTLGGGSREMGRGVEASRRRDEDTS
jgi:hypothetical protein